MAFPTPSNKQLTILAIIVLAIIGGWYGWSLYKASESMEGFVSGNGRIEATEVDVSTKLPGRVESVMVREGDFVQAGQTLANMQITTLQAQYE